MRIRDLAELATINIENVPLEQIALLAAREQYPDLVFSPYLLRRRFVVMEKLNLVNNVIPAL